MANEISLAIGTTGLTGLYCRTLQGTTLGGNIALAEVSGAGGIYAGNMSGTAGYYSFAFYDSTDTLIASAPAAYWDGSQFDVVLGQAFPANFAALAIAADGAIATVETVEDRTLTRRPIIAEDLP